MPMMAKARAMMASEIAMVGPTQAGVSCTWSSMV